MKTRRGVAKTVWVIVLLLTLVGGSAAPCWAAPERVAESHTGASSSGGRWVWEAGGTFRDISMASASSGWIVGSGGLILRTDDGGETLVPQDGITTQNLTGVQAISANTAYAVGGGGTILKTSDGGATWVAHTSGTTQDLRALQFVDASTGWAVGRGGTILHTGNGGSTWTPQVSGTSLDLNALSFLDATRGWVVGNQGTLLHTTNGSTWTPLISGMTEDLAGVFFVDGMHGWITAPNVLARTTDGGATWHQTVPTDGLAFQHDLSDLHFRSTTEGWVLGTIFYGAQLICHTTDGGLTLVCASLGDLGHSYALDFYGDDQPWIVGSSGTLYHSSDGASTWTRQQGTAMYLLGVQMHSPTLGWVGGYDREDHNYGHFGRLYRTQDGATWPALSAYDDGGFEAIHFVTPSTAFATMMNMGPWPPFQWGDLLGTVNGGADWSYVPWTGSTVRGWHDIQMVGSQGWVVGEAYVGSGAEWQYDHAIVGYSSDSGATWSERAQIPGGRRLNGVDFVNATSGWVVGADASGSGMIYHTTDGGLSWSPQASIAGSPLYDVDFVAPTTGWAVGSSGAILHTADGTYWAPQTGSTGEQLRGVDFFDPLHGWAVGGSSILRTNDGGITWETEAAPRGIGSLQDIFMLDGYHGWAVGWYGTIIAWVQELPDLPRWVPAVYAATAPTIDGNLVEWASLPQTVLNSATARWVDWGGGAAPTWQDASTVLQSKWKGTGLSFGIKISDDVIKRDSGDQVWNDDQIEIWIDGDASGTIGGPYDHQLTISSDCTLTDWGGATTATAACRSISGGWTAELLVPAALLPPALLTEAGNVGLAFGYRDDDDGGAWDQRMLWEGDETNNSNAGQYGLLVLTDRPASRRTAHAVGLASAPVLDGDLSEWPGYELWGLHDGSARWSNYMGGAAADHEDIGMLLQPGWTGSGLYLGMQVFDDALVHDSLAEFWKDDEIEVWIDGNRDGAMGGAYDHQYTFNTDGSVTDGGSPSPVTVGWQVLAGGWAVEAMIPASELPPGVLSTGGLMGFTFGVRDDDDGGTWEARLLWEGDDQNNSTASHYGTLLLGAAEPTPTATATPTSSPTATYTATNTPTPSPSATYTPTTTPTATSTPTPTASAIPLMLRLYLPLLLRADVAG